MRKSSLLFVAIMLLSLVGCGQSTQPTTNPTLKPNPVSDFNYYLNEEKQCINITEYIGESKVVVVPASIENLPVRFIGMSSFAGTSVETVVLPDTVEEIWPNAFDGCQSLKSIQLSVNLIKIDIQAFRNCVNLDAITLPDGINQIGTEAFAYCSSVTQLRIPGSLEEIGHSAFAKMYALSTLVIEDGVKSLGYYGTFIDADALKEVTIPASVEILGDACFAGCNNLEKVSILGDTPNDVGDMVFQDTSENLIIYYDPNTSGWDDTPLSQYNLVAK